jgi:hypothetical protein
MRAREWSTGGYAPGMLLVVTADIAKNINSSGHVPLGLCMAVRHGGDAFWYYAPVVRDGDCYTARLDKEFHGYAWAQKNDVQPDQRQRYLLLAGGTVELKAGGNGP